MGSIYKKIAFSGGFLTAKTRVLLRLGQLRDDLQRAPFWQFWAWIQVLVVDEAIRRIAEMRVDG